MPSYAYNKPPSYTYNKSPSCAYIKSASVSGGLHRTFVAQSLTHRMNFHSQNARVEAPIRVAVIVATKGRPQAIAELLALLEKQSCAPAVIVISATEPSDIGVTPATHLNLEYLFGPADQACQPLPAAMDFRERAVVRFLDERFIDPAEISDVGLVRS